MVLPAIVKVFPDVLLTVVGDGTPEFEATLKSAITAQKLKDNEAMQMGVPVLISNRVNTWPYVKAADAGVVLDEERIESNLEHAILS